ncbi:MAG TPA: glycosyltransferase family 39 protein [Terriglobales bacterium]
MSFIELLKRNRRWFLLAALAGLALRLMFILYFRVVDGDPLVYANIAQTWMKHGIYGQTLPQGIRPTMIRLPGYPAFLVVIFSLFGQQNFVAVMLVQVVIDLATCALVSALALELMGERAAKAAFLIAALCPFTANFTAIPITETWAIFCAAAVLYCAVRGLRSLEQESVAKRWWITAGLASGAGMLMRPDGGILVAAVLLALLVVLVHSRARVAVVLSACVFLLASFAPLVPWTVRNWRTFHVFQPLAPRHANDPGEFVALGYIHWTKTWIADYVSVSEISWNLGTEPLDVNLLPARAFDSESQREQVTDLFELLKSHPIDPALDAQFEHLAQQRIAHVPLRYYVWLPAMRVASMWLRPRVEFLGLDLRWWEVEDDPKECCIDIAYGALNLALLIAAVAGFWKWRSLGASAWLLVGFVVLRTAFLATIENPEPRYVIECFPVVLLYAGAAFASSKNLSGSKRAAVC